MNAVRSLVRFHLQSGARVASRNAIATVCLIIIVLGSAPDPWVWLRFLALGVAGAGFGAGPLIGLTAIAFGLSQDAVPRLTLGLGGWTRSLPLDGVQHRRGVMLGLPIIQLPLAASVVIAAMLTRFAYHVPLSWPKLLGAALALLAAGAVAIPTRRWPAGTVGFGASALLASLGQWRALGVALLLFALTDAIAGALRFAPSGSSVTPAAPGALHMFRFTWRALGWRLLAPAPLPLLALAAAWFYTRNNDLVGADVSFVARLWSVIAIALYVGAVGDAVVSRRPPWPWSRSLPWSSTGRAMDDAIAIGAPAAIVAIAAAVVDVRTVLVALALVPPLAAFAAGSLHGARRRLTRVSGPLVLTGIGMGTAIAFWPWVAAIALASTPLLIRSAARRDRNEVVTGWKELYHDATGDSLSWSSR